MNKKQLAILRTRLEEEKARLEEAIAEMEREDRETLSEASGENNYRDHMADQGSATFERELDLTLEENVRVSLGEVNQALERIDQGDYGVCAGCKGGIPKERLEAVPTASLCIACKEAEEAH
jgi:DnaK suppressor protein